MVKAGEVLSVAANRTRSPPDPSGHAEIVALREAAAKLGNERLADCDLYVTLEPCNHQGKTPPCSDLILEHKIPRVFIGCTDPNPLVAGKGIEKLKAAGVEVELARNPKPFEELNKFFFLNQKQKRPYVLLKWAIK